MSKTWYKYWRNHLVSTFSYPASKMESPKFLVIACALLIVQAQAHPQPPVKGVLMDIIKFIVPKAEDALDWIIDTSSKIFDEAAKDPVGYQVRTAENLDKAINKIFDGINEELDRIKERGSANSRKYIDCVEDAKVPIKNVLVGFYSRTTECMAPEVQDLLQKLAAIQPDLKEIKNKAFAAADKVQGCSGTNAEEAHCLAEVVEGVLDSLRGTPSEVIQKALDIILTIVNKLENHIPKCVTPNFEQAKIEAIQALDGVTACSAA